MPPTVEPAHAELDTLKDLLADDRSAAGEARRAGRRPQLQTASYHMPLRTRVRRRWRGDRQLRKRTLGSCLAALAAVLLWQLPSYHGAPSLAAEPRAPVVTSPALRTAAIAPAMPVPPPAQHSAPAPVADALSPRRRLGRADLWLRVGSERGAREARTLIESALIELPESAHGQASLAEACLQLGDQRCAREAVERAMKARPWRAGYRVLARRIDQAFAAQR